MVEYADHFDFPIVDPEKELLHPYGMGADLAILVMRSLRWLADPDEGGRQRSDEDRAKFNDLAEAFRDFLVVHGGAGDGIETHPALLAGDRTVADEAMDDALARMKGLFERGVIDHMWI